jgi:hypothetical protein
MLGLDIVHHQGARVQFHIDIGPICWQFVSVVDNPAVHEEEAEERHEVTSHMSIGFQPNEDEEDE